MGEVTFLSSHYNKSSSQQTLAPQPFPGSRGKNTPQTLSENLYERLLNFRDSKGQLIVGQDVRGVDRGAPLGHRSRIRGQQGRGRVFRPEVSGMLDLISLSIWKTFFDL